MFIIGFYIDPYDGRTGITSIGVEGKDGCIGVVGKDGCIGV